MRAIARTLAPTLATAILLTPGLAAAHFQLVSPTSWWSQTSDGSPQKMAPCGNETTAGTSASKMVTKVQPGQTVAVQVMATVAHPGWYRISLRQGAASTQTATVFPDPPTLGAAGSAQQCTPAFIDNPVWSPTQPVLADKLGLPAGSTSTTTTQSGTKTFNVTIPSDAVCTSAAPCTLQVLMFMTDHPSGSCNYHHCADIAFDSADGGGGDAKADSGASGTGGNNTTGTGGSNTAGTGGNNTAGTGGNNTTGSGGHDTAGTGGNATVKGTGGEATVKGTGGAMATGSGGAGGTTSNDGGGCAVGGRHPSALAACVALLALAALTRRRRR